MKKMMKLSAIFVAFALLAASFMGCDDGGGGGGSKKITITFDLNYTGSPKAETVKIAKNAALGTLPANPTRAHTNSAKEWGFGGWYLNTGGTGTQVTAASTFAVSTTVYAKWTERDKAAETDCRVTFNAAPGTLPSGHAGYVDITKGTKPTAAQVAAFPTPTPQANFRFDGWFLGAGGTGDAFDTNYMIPATAATLTVYAKYSALVMIAITVNTNAPAAYTGTTLDAINPIQIAQGTAIGTLLPGAPVAGGAAVTEMTFNGWFTAATGGTEVTGATTFAAAATIFAHWTLIDLETQFILVFDYNYDGASPRTIQKTVTIGEALGSDWPADPTRTDFNFVGWFQYEAGTGDQYTSTSTNLASTREVNGYHSVFARWEATNVVDELPPDGKIVAGDGTEKFTSQNGCFIIYRFVIPAGKNLSNYEELWADYMFGPSQLVVGGGPRTTRVMGSYNNSDFTLLTGMASNFALQNLAVAAFDAKNGPYIVSSIDTTNQGSKDMETWLDSKGYDSTAWAWNTIKYPHPTKTASGNGSAGPEADATGTLYFGVGFGGVGNAITSYVRNVKLIGDANTTDLVGIPLYFKIGDTVYPALAGYADSSGGNGTKEAYRGFEDGSTPDPVTYAYVVTFDAQNGSPTTTRNVIVGNAIGTINNPEGTGLFKGWNTKANESGDTVDSTYIPTADITVYGIWTDDAVTITFDGDGGTPAAASKLIAQGGTLSASDLEITKPGFILVKWVIEGEDDAIQAGVTIFDEDTTIKAIWDPAVTVTIALNNGAKPTTKLIKQGTALGSAFPANPTRAYFDFTGWNTKLDGKGTVPTNATVFNVDTTIYATWKAMNLTDKDFVYLKDGATAGNGVDAGTAVVTTSATNDTAFTAAWQRSAELLFPITLPTGVRVSNYTSYSIKAKFYNADMEELTGADLKLSMAQIVFTKDPSTAGTNDTGNIGSQYNLGVKNDANDARIIGDHTPFPAATLAAAPDFKGFYLQAAQNFVAYIEVYEIVFHGPTQAVAIVIDAPIDQLGTLTNKTWSVGSGDLSIIAPIDIDSYKWLVNGVAAGTPDTKLDFVAANYLNKINTTFTVTLLATRNGKNYSQTVIVTVKK